jgi:hypothetical protein
MAATYYRGGPSLKPRPHDIRVDRVAGLVQPTHGVSVFDRPDGLERFGGAYRTGSLPDNLKIIQRGRDQHHYEIVPANPMTVAEYEEALSKILLVPV